MEILVNPKKELQWRLQVLFGGGSLLYFLYKIHPKRAGLGQEVPEDVLHEEAWPVCGALLSLGCYPKP